MISHAGRKGTMRKPENNFCLSDDLSWDRYCIDVVMSWFDQYIYLILLVLTDGFIPNCNSYRLNDLV